MNYAELNDIVTIHYSISYTNGQPIESSNGKAPVRFKLGSKTTLPYINKLILGMRIGDIKTKTIKGSNAFGKPSKKLIKTIGIETVPKHIKKEVGNKVEIQIENDIPFKAAISAISKTSITLDANPEFIKKDLVIKVELLDIEVESTWK